MFRLNEQPITSQFTIIRLNNMWDIANNVIDSPGNAP